MTNRSLALAAQTAAVLLDCRRRRRQLDVLPENLRPRSSAEAYAVQDEVAAQLWPVGGWKTGAPGPAAEPIAAPIGEPLVHASGTALAAADFHLLGIEGELAYRMGDDLPPIAGGYDRNRVTAAIASLHAAIELVDSRVKDWQSADPLWKLADNQSNGGLVIGAKLEQWQHIDPLRQRAILRINGAIAVDAVGGNAAGDPLRLLVWLANHCATRCGGLRAGDIVTTGTYTGLVLVQPGDEVAVEFPGLGEARVQFM